MESLPAFFTLYVRERKRGIMRSFMQGWPMVSVWRFFCCAAENPKERSILWKKIHQKRIVSSSYTIPL
jgi:hypothetical protein